MAKREVSKSQTPAASQKTNSKSLSTADQSFYQQNLFFSLALDMTWQLALVVIVPIVGGFLLDKHYRTTPWLTLAGFLLAAVGVFAVLSHVVSQANQRSQLHDDRGKS